MTSIQTIIYLAGFVATWLLCKKLRGTDLDYNNDWKDILTTAICSFLSWFAFAVLLLLYGIYLLLKKTKIKTPKPPKFL